MPQQQPLAPLQPPIPRVHPRPCLALPLHPERVQHLHPIVPVRRPVRVARVRLERAELAARPRDGVHAAQRERAEVRVERVQRVPESVFGDGGRDELRRDLHVAQGVDELELALEALEGVDHDRAVAPEDVRDDAARAGGGNVSGLREGGEGKERGLRVVSVGEVLDGLAEPAVLLRNVAVGLADDLRERLEGGEAVEDGRLGELACAYNQCVCAYIH